MMYASRLRSALTYVRSIIGE